MGDGTWPCRPRDGDAAIAGVTPMTVEHRRGLWAYRSLGFVGDCCMAAMAYIVRLEDELARREREESMPS